MLCCSASLFVIFTDKSKKTADNFTFEEFNYKSKKTANISILKEIEWEK
ncbi:hypothetical protein T4B_13273 [Trichinella pseudospiralis]|uniref:Uncharacterized protein n=1 Tax=Trichinella pseudospiralis TaxID=6337 RepID=A0A0V1G9B7_TRIPS|nr:hypothetical protein T4B_13273 [Trichinella pseudospiralis]